jgi:hypothetical protein
VQHERHVALGAFPRLAAVAAGEEVRPAAPVEQHDRLARRRERARVSGCSGWRAPRISSTRTGGMGARVHARGQLEVRHPVHVSGRGVAEPASRRPPRVAAARRTRSTGHVRAS